MKSKFPRGVELVCSAIIRRKDGKILLARSPKWSNKWTLPGGHVEAGEKILDAAKREAEEETRLSLTPVKILASGELIAPVDFHRPAHFVYFDCIFDVAGNKVKLQKDELSEWGWFTPEEAQKLDLAESYPEVLQQYIESLKNM